MYEESGKLIKELDAFAHTVAHDLKNPLTLITGYAEMLLEDYDVLSEAQHKEYLQDLLKGATKAAKIIEALLLMARVRSLKVVEIGPLDMGAIVQEVCARLRPQIEEKGAQVVLPDGWPSARGYAPWIEEVWMNYVSNAIKYGGQPPRVELGSDEPAGGKIRFWVRDNGQGLTPHEQARLFSPFTRLRPVTTEGHGLGLSIVQRIAERLSGEVGVESQAGQGSLFYFTLPAGDGDRREEAHSLESAPSRGEGVG
jgi:signal transduction histidine kinase